MATAIKLLNGDTLVVDGAPEVVARALDRRGEAIRFERGDGGAVWVNPDAVASFTEVESDSTSPS
jgi:hypothetical protein